jgi:DNA-binding SARP family transcriptional activator
MAAVKISLLGPPVVEVGGVPLALDTRKAVLLAHLAIDRDAQSRDHLLYLLWPGADQDRVLAADLLKSGPNGI